MQRVFKRHNSLNKKVLEVLKLKIVKKSKGKYGNSLLFSFEIMKKTIILFFVNVSTCRTNEAKFLCLK